jgi:hypothetical protein
MRKGTDANSWFLGVNVEGKHAAPLFYFGRANVYINRLVDVAEHHFVELTTPTDAIDSAEGETE